MKKILLAIFSILIATQVLAAGVPTGTLYLVGRTASRLSYITSGLDIQSVDDLSTWVAGDGTFITVTSNGSGGVDIDFVADYADISTNDSATDVTGAELETLTDGSSTSLHIHPDTAVTVQGLSSPTVDTQHEFNTNYASAGLIDAADVTAICSDGGGETVDTTAFIGALRATDDHTGELYQFDFDATTGNAIPTDTVRYLGVEYNSGTPQVVIKTTDAWNMHDEFSLCSVVNEGGTLHILNNPEFIANSAMHTIHRFYETEPMQRADRIGGLMLGETGTRNVTVTAGELYDRNTEFPISAIDTSGADRFDCYTSAGIETSSQSQWDNANYDNSGVLTALTNNWYANIWWWVEADGSLVCMYGTDEYPTLSGAENEAIPAVIPDRLTVHGKFLGRFVFQEGGAATEGIDSAFIVSLAPGGVSDHGDLSGLTDDDHTQYPLVDGTRGFNQSNAAGAIPALPIEQADEDEPAIKIIGIASSGSVVHTLVDTGDVSTATVVGYVKIEIQDDGNQIVDGDYYMPVYTLVAVASTTDQGLYRTYVPTTGLGAIGY